MRIDHLYEFIVPFIFIVIWAVTWILNREAQALPPRSAARLPDDQSGLDRTRGGEPIRELRDPRGASPPPRPFRPPSPGLERSTARERGLGPGDAIVFTEPELGGPTGPFEKSPSDQRPARGGQGRRASRSRGSAAARPRPRPTPEKPRELTQEISTSMANLKGKPLTLTPLDLPLSPLSVTFTSSSLSSVAPTSGSSNTATDSSNFREALADPARLREILVWNELVQPPLAMRQGPFRRR